ncbi:MAG TPA: response regulator transcription factor, partial [Roseiflexaceae bacterium]|nr:response regulator transcription factor [Roseiflexaceae bacterium]
MTDIRVLIVEDQTLMRQGLRTILDLNDGFSVVGEAEHGQEAVERALALQPDVVLMDVQMPVMNGVDATAAITQALPATKVIILTTFDYDEYVFDAMKAGARGYMLKDVPAAELLATIRRIQAGESIVQPSVATRLIAE